ncbi:adenine/guanine phosphoribosyltransferase-like PRPP-binding protein [Humitalea rosea]|uniref:Adenine/guanine phosphoribosyltransferase-like PRPP-binding protein n=2 Tax=Humitalea rosea TaxID=990373 RepID=A0A2W7IWV8_9PROT|nr:adenine/guanine phosphoribosyltransferase-like PRPP-binding protein [Humitalea rosea]
MGRGGGGAVRAGLLSRRMTGPWQNFIPAAPAPLGYHGFYPAPMPDGSCLELPLRDRGTHAVAGLIVNQASFTVLRALAAWMTATARKHGAEVVVGLPTLGQSLAPLVAEGLGHTNWVAPGWSRKTWYDEALSVSATSSTSPDPRAMWLDPNLLPRLAGRRVLLVDDVLASGVSAAAGVALLATVGVRPVALSVAMIQGDRWRPLWAEDIPVSAAFATPLFDPHPAGWLPRPETAPHALCRP